MRHDLVPALTGLLAGTVPAVAIPGPTHSEWTSVLMPALALVVRELVWWFRNRNKKG